MTENIVTAEDLLIAQAVEQASKPPRVKSVAVLAAIVEFVNSGEKTYKHFEDKYPSKNAAALRTLIKKNTALNGRVWPIDTDEFGTMLVNLSAATES